MTIFDDQPVTAALDRLMREFRDTLGQSGPTQPPEVTIYEIVGEA